MLARRSSSTAAGCLLVRDAQQQTQDQEVGHDGAATIADERQGDARKWDELERTGQDDQRLQSDPRGETGREQSAEAGPRPKRDQESAYDEHDEEIDDRERADQAELLADGRDHEVGVHGRNVEWGARAEASTEHAPG